MQNIRNFILNLYPTTKIIIVFLISVSVFVLPGVALPFITVPILFIITFLAGKTKPFLNIFLKVLLVVSIMIFLLQSFFYPGETVVWNIGPLSMTKEGIIFSLKLISKILSMGSGLVAFFQITKVKDLVHSLEKIGFPSMMTYIILSTFQIMPEMRRTSSTIMDAQKSRGIETEGNLLVRIKAFIPTLAPLLLTSISNTEERSITLEARAFTVKGKKTSLYELSKTKNDILIRILAILAFISLIVWRVII